MNYEKVYKSLTKSNDRNKKEGYYELHHIIPKCVGGTNSKNNLVLLTAREHYISHILLVKIYENTEFYHKLLWAYNGMRVWKNKDQERNYSYNSKLYESLKGNYKHSTETKEKIRVGNLGKKLTNEHKLKISETRKQLAKDGKLPDISGVNNPMYGKVYSDEWKEKQSERLKGIPKSNKENYSKKGETNNNAKLVKIFNSNNNLMFESKGSFKEICKNNNLPYAPLYRSYKNNTKLFQSKASQAQAINSGMIIYKGWYATLIN